jgi:hypothetical protein
MKNWMTRVDAETFTEHFEAIDIKLDDPGWNPGFQDLIEAWNTARGDKPVPTRKDIDLLQMPKLLPVIQVYEMVGDPSDMNAQVIFQGADLARYTREESGVLEFGDDYPGGKGKQMFFKYLSFVLTWPAPFWADGQLSKWRRQQFVNEKYISLPVSSNGTVIDGAITASYLYGKALHRA